MPRGQAGATLPSGHCLQLVWRPQPARGLAAKPAGSGDGVLVPRGSALGAGQCSGLGPSCSLSGGPGGPGAPTSGSALKGRTLMTFPEWAPRKCWLEVTATIFFSFFFLKKEQQLGRLPRLSVPAQSSRQPWQRAWRGGVEASGPQTSSPPALLTRQPCSHITRVTRFADSPALLTLRFPRVPTLALAVREGAAEPCCLERPCRAQARPRLTSSAHSGQRLTCTLRPSRAGWS